VIRAGTYRENLRATRGGTRTRPIIVAPAPGERVVLEPASSDRDNIPLQIGTGASFIRFDGLIVQGARGPSTTNIYAWGSAHDIEITRCEVRRSARQGFFSESTTRSIRISRCYFHDNGGGGARNLDHNLYVEGERHVIVNCLITNATNGFGVQLYPESDNVLITNNTIVENRSGVVIGGEGRRTTVRARLVNNIIGFNRVYGITTYWGEGSSGSANLAELNLVFGNGERDLDEAGGVAFTANVVSNPRFANRNRRDFALRPDSPALDRALPAFAPGYDFEGRHRPQGRRADLGAFERKR